MTVYKNVYINLFFFFTKMLRGGGDPTKNKDVIKLTSYFEFIYFYCNRSIRGTIHISLDTSALKLKRTTGLKCI